MLGAATINSAAVGSGPWVGSGLRVGLLQLTD